MGGVPDYSSALGILKNIRAARLAPNVVTYNTLINEAPNYDVAKAWVEMMREEGIQPDVVAYSTLYAIVSKRLKTGKQYYRCVAYAHKKSYRVCFK